MYRMQIAMSINLYGFLMSRLSKKEWTYGKQQKVMTKVEHHYLIL